MVTRRERIDIAVKAETQESDRRLERTQRNVRGLGSSVRGLALPFLGGALLGGLLGGSLFSLATASAESRNAIFQLQGVVESTLNRLFEVFGPFILQAISFFDRLPAWVQILFIFAAGLAVLGPTLLSIGGAIGVAAAAVLGLVSGFGAWALIVGDFLTFLSPAALTIGAIGAAVAVMALAATDVVSGFGFLARAYENTASPVLKAFLGILQTIGEVVAIGFTPTIAGMTLTLQSIGQPVKDLIGFVGGLIDQFLLASAVVKIVGGIISGVWATIVEAAREPLGTIVGIISFILNAFRLIPYHTSGDPITVSGHLG